MGDCSAVPGIPALETIFVVKTDNNPLTYILTTPYVDATWHHWVESLTEFTFSIEHQKGRDNAVADALSHVASKLNAEAVKSILDGVTIGITGMANAHHLTVAEADKRIHKQVEEAAVQAWATHTCVNLHVTDWVAAQQEDPILKIVMEQISSHKVQDLKHLLGEHAMTEEDMAILRERKKFMLHQVALYHHHTLAGELEEALQFVVLMAHRVAAMNGTIGTWDIRANGNTVPVARPALVAWHGDVMQKAINSCERCIHHEGAQAKAPYKLFWSSLLWSYFMWISLD